MNPAALLLPLLITLAGTTLAALFWLSPLRGRLTITQLAWLLSLAPLAAFLVLLSFLPSISKGQALTWSFEWIPALGLSAGLYFDSLSALFALVVAGIGTVVVIYAGYYFKESPTSSPSEGDREAPRSDSGVEGRRGGDARFLTYLLLFMASMLGVVMAGDVVTLFIFWEGTSITSFLLVAYKTKDEEARKGAFQALFITGGGGIALLAGLLMVSFVTGSTEFTAILGSGDALRNSAIYPVLLLLVAFGAFTKSAQFPAHIWLPRAMTAPTPASAYLHSATMVNAGIYLMARMNPALGFTDLWFFLLTGVGMTTMVLGAYLGLKQNDLKALLAYSTISQLGLMMAMIGQDIGIAFKSLVIAVLAHALYKSALFLVAGIVDHETGTRDLRRLGGLRKAMPATFVVAVVAGLSMAGLPPLFGFLAKETLLATATHPELPAIASGLMVVASVAAGALLLAQAGLFVFDTFLGKSKDPSIHAHEAPWGMVLAAAMPAMLSLLIGIAPEPQRLANLLANAASAAYGEKVKVSLALWTGLNVPLFLSVIAISIGLVIFAQRTRVRALMMRTGDRWGFQQLYLAVLSGIDRLAAWATRLQSGKLRTYLSIMLATVLLLVVSAIALARTPLWRADYALTLPYLDFRGEVAILRLFALAVVVGSAIATIVLQRDFAAVIALGASGLAIAVLMVLEPSPDVALVQIVVDILSTVILVLALTRLPRLQRHRANLLPAKQSRGSLARDAGVATGMGMVVGLVTLLALVSRPHASIVTPFYEANAKVLTGAKDIVGAIVVDFRGFDTVIEITVFAMAGLGIYTLLRYASKTAGDSVSKPPPARAKILTTVGIGGQPTSPFVHALAYAILPLAMLIAVTHMMYGHNQPGDGFTAGVIISLGVAFWYVVFGYENTKRRLTWLKPTPLIGAGLLLVIASSPAAAFVNGSFFSPVDFGAMLSLPLPAGFSLSSSFLFELAICLAVLGSASYMLDTLGHPGEG